MSMPPPPPSGQPGGFPAPPPGYQPYGSPGQGMVPNSGMAVASLVLGLVSVLCCFFGLPIPGILSIIFGFTSRKQTRTGERRGAGMATAGIVLGIVTVALAAIFWIYVVTSGDCTWEGGTFSCDNIG